MKEKGTPKLYAWIGILAVGVLIGLFAYAQILAKGHAETLGVSDQIPWGLFIIGFAFFIGASAGATIIGLMIHAFGRDDYRPLGIPALLVGILSLTAAMVFIAMDVGNLARMFLVPWFLRNPSSMFFYTSTTYYLFTLILLGELFFTIRLVRGSTSSLDKRMARSLAIAAVPVALWVLHAPHGALFGVVKAREYWNTPLLPPHFAIAALVTGTAIMILVALITSSVNKRPLVSRRTLDHMGKLLALFAVVTFFFDFFDILVMNYGETPEGIQIWGLLTGKYLGLYVLNLGGLIATVLILLSRKGRQPGGLALASSIAVLAVAAYRYNLVVVGQSVPLWEGQTGVSASYAPSSIEVSVAVGIISAALLAYTVLVRLLPAEGEESHFPQAEAIERQLVSSVR